MDNNTRTSTITGTVLVLLFKLNIADLVTSAMLAAIGATIALGFQFSGNSC